MELRIDRLLQALRDRPADILAAIDADPLLVKREVDGLVLANAAKGLFSPQEVHQLYAKGIVYRRDPYRLVSLPLLKIHNLGERNVTAADLAAFTDARVHFLRKFDGTMIQRFQHDGRVHFTTRGMLEGLPAWTDEDGQPYRKSFDYLAAARQVAAGRYPRLVEALPALEDLTLVLELIHPEARVVTDYRDRRDLILLAAFDHRSHAYWPVDRLRGFAAEQGLTLTDILTPNGETLSQRIDALIAALAGTDEEGSVLVLEQGEEVVYRVKVKSPEYVKLVRLMLNCTYAATADLLGTFADVPDWPAFEAHLRSLGTDKVPEEIVESYREHHAAHLVYRADCERLRQWAQARADALKATLPAGEPREIRKRFAAAAKGEHHSSLLFLALDGRLDSRRIREFVPTPFDVTDALARVG